MYRLYCAYYTGSRSGRVVDPNGVPVANAVVSYVWKASYLIFADSIVASHQTLTDKEGRYYIPNQKMKRLSLVFESLYPESVLIYKDGYVLYENLWDDSGERVGRSLFDSPDQYQKYRKKNNLAVLKPWREGIGLSHTKHIRHIHWGSMHGGGYSKKN